MKEATYAKTVARPLFNTNSTIGWAVQRYTSSFVASSSKDWNTPRGNKLIERICTQQREAYVIEKKICIVQVLRYPIDAKFAVVNNRARVQASDLVGEKK
jgi:hypothetical protein